MTTKEREPLSRPYWSAVMANHFQRLQQFQDWVLYGTIDPEAIKRQVKHAKSKK